MSELTWPHSDRFLPFDYWQYWFWWARANSVHFASNVHDFANKYLRFALGELVIFRDDIINLSGLSYLYALFGYLASAKLSNGTPDAKLNAIGRRFLDAGSRPGEIKPVADADLPFANGRLLIVHALISINREVEAQ
jgi:hypothetical protein